MATTTSIERYVIDFFTLPGAKPNTMFCEIVLKFWETHVKVFLTAKSRLSKNK